MVSAYFIDIGFYRLFGFVSALIKLLAFFLLAAREYLRCFDMRTSPMYLRV